MAPLTGAAAPSCSGRARREVSRREAKLRAIRGSPNLRGHAAFYLMTISTAASPTTACHHASTLIQGGLSMNPAELRRLESARGGVRSQKIERSVQLR